MPAFVYAASKTEAERQAWQWVAENKPSFVFNTVLPNVNVRPYPMLNLFHVSNICAPCQFGKILMPEIPGSSTNAVRNLLAGDASRLRWFPPRKLFESHLFGLF
jgi:hypothetical protein